MLLPKHHRRHAPWLRPGLAALLALGLAGGQPAPSRATDAADLFLPLALKGYPGFSLRFFGNGVDDIDRVKIGLDGPARPVDVGATDFTLEFWIKANPGENASGGVNCDSNDGWIYGNIVFDRDIYGTADFDDYGVALTDGRLAFGASYQNSGNTLCGSTDIADGAWHHVAVTRRYATGQLSLYLDGVLETQADGNTGSNRNLSYRDGRSTSWPNSDPFLVIGAEKHDAGPAYPSFSGWLDEVRLSTALRYTANFTRPAAPFLPDANTAALYHFDEGAGDTVNDSSGAAGGPSHGLRRFGGAPAGPVWSLDTPF